MEKSSRTLDQPVLALLLLVAGACDSGSGGLPWAAPLEPIASGRVPLTQKGDFAVTGPHTACLMDTYNARIVCGDRSWQDTVAFGREGRGPGEIGAFGYLLSGPEGSASFLDFVNGRITLFSRDDSIAELMLPDLTVLAPASEILPDTSYYARPALLPGATPELLARRFSGFSAEVIDTVRVSVDVSLLRVEEIITLSGLYRSPAGDFVLRANTPIGPRMARFRADGSFVDVIEPPTAEVVYPSERDVEEYIDGWVRVFREKPSESQVAEYRSRVIGDFPKVPMHRLVQFDSRGRLWVISTRPVDGGTFVDVYDDTGRVESHVLRGRVRGIQIVDSLLVAFSEYGVTEFGLPDQRLDWYRWTATATANAACAKAGSGVWPRGSTRRRRPTRHARRPALPCGRGMRVGPPAGKDPDLDPRRSAAFRKLPASREGS